MYQILGIAAFIVILFIVGQLLWILLPFILIYMVIKAVLNMGKPKKTSGGRRTRTYYYTSNAKDFEEFFRRAGGNQNYGNFNYENSQGNPYQAFEDKTQYYTTLGIESGATQEDIKKAYRSMARKHHPDRYATAEDDIKAYHEKKFKEINEAYDKLAKKN